MMIETLLTLALALSTPASAAQQCDDPLFQVSAETPEMTARICQAATTARNFLSTCGVILDTQLNISVQTSLTGELGPCLGIFHRDENLIEILSPTIMAAVRDVEGVFGKVSDGAFWDSVLVHELTHAAYDRVTCPFADCVATSEYVSYVMQVLSLPAEEQARFGTTVTLSAPPSRDGLSAIMLFMAPDRFAKIAWLHFQSRPDPCGYMNLIMNGQIYFDREVH